MNLPVGGLSRSVERFFCNPSADGYLRAGRGGGRRVVSLVLGGGWDRFVGDGVDEVDDGLWCVGVGCVPGGGEQGEPGAGDEGGEPGGLPGADDVECALGDDDWAMDAVQPGGHVEHDRVP